VVRWLCDPPAGQEDPVHHSGGEAVVGALKDMVDDSHKMGFAGECLTMTRHSLPREMPYGVIPALLTGQEDPVHHSGGEAVVGALKDAVDDSHKMGFAGESLLSSRKLVESRHRHMLTGLCANPAGQEDPVHHSGGEAVISQKDAVDDSHKMGFAGERPVLINPSLCCSSLIVSRALCDLHRPGGPCSPLGR
jgi:hypothetical protein